MLFHLMVEQHILPASINYAISKIRRTQECVTETIHQINTGFAITRVGLTFYSFLC